MISSNSRNKHPFKTHYYRFGETLALQNNDMQDPCAEMTGMEAKGGNTA
jgi:hypothetical protein